MDSSALIEKLKGGEALLPEEGAALFDTIRTELQTLKHTDPAKYLELLKELERSIEAI